MRIIGKLGWRHRVLFLFIGEGTEWVGDWATRGSERLRYSCLRRRWQRIIDPVIIVAIPFIGEFTRMSRRGIAFALLSTPPPPPPPQGRISQCAVCMAVRCVSRGGDVWNIPGEKWVAVGENAWMPCVRWVKCSDDGSTENKNRFSTQSSRQTRSLHVHSLALFLSNSRELLKGFSPGRWGGHQVGGCQRWNGRGIHWCFQGIVILGNCSRVSLLFYLHDASVCAGFGRKLWTTLTPPRPHPALWEVGTWWDSHSKGHVVYIRFRVELYSTSAWVGLDDAIDGVFGRSFLVAGLILTKVGGFLTMLGGSLLAECEVKPWYCVVHMWCCLCTAKNPFLIGQKLCR